MTKNVFVAPESVFGNYHRESYPHQFAVSLWLETVVGGVPSDPKVAEGWIRAKIQDNDERIRQMVAKTMEERNVTAEEALQIVNDLKNLNGFKRTDEGELYIEGRQVKAMLKEAVSVAIGAGKITIRGWGETKKWITNYFPEHVFVDEDVVGLGVKEPSGVLQQFVHTHRGSSIQYQEYVKEATINFTVVTDHDFKEREWAMLWTTAERNGLGASRSQGYGRFAVTRWEKLR